MRIKNIIFDFDGVLLESVNAKTEAFRALYLPFGVEIADAVCTYHLAHGGVSRFAKLEHWHKELLGIELSEIEILEWAGRFGELAFDKVMASDEVPGAEEFIRTNHKRFQQYVITGTPEIEIHEIIRRKGWTNYFKGIFGSPTEKKVLTANLIAEAQLKKDETVFIGDATTDMEAARHAGIHFILRRSEENEHLFKDYSGFELNDLNELEKVLKSI